MKLRKIHLPHPQFSQSGFTIIESLVALIVVALLLAAVAPVIVLATATRLQARRVELATQAARAYIDGVKAGTIKDTSTILSLTAATSAANKQLTDTSVNDYTFNNVSAPSSSNGLNCFTASGNISTVCDGTSSNTSPNTTPLFYIQAVQSTVALSDPDKGASYRLGVRIYRADAFTGGGTPIASDSNTKRTQATFTGGLGNRYAPLVEMTTDIVRSEPSYSGYCQRLGGCQQ